MADAPVPPAELTRRDLLVRAAVTGGMVAVGGALAACGSQEHPTVPGRPSPTAVSASQVPVGGGVIVAEAGTVVTQPSPGEFKAFSAVCPHQGCLVSRVEAGTILCACHGSRFSAADGSVVTGPAVRPLPARTITSSGDTLTVD